MSRFLRLTLIGVATFIVCIAVFAPASLVRYLIKDGGPVALVGPTGTIWRGSGDLAIAGTPIGRVNWSFAPSMLLTGDLGFDVEVRGEQGRPHRARERVGKIGPRGVQRPVRHRPAVGHARALRHPPARHDRGRPRRPHGRLRGAAAADPRRTEMVRGRRRLPFVRSRSRRRAAAARRLHRLIFRSAGNIRVSSGR